MNLNSVFKAGYLSELKMKRTIFSFLVIMALSATALSAATLFKRKSMLAKTKGYGYEIDANLGTGEDGDIPGTKTGPVIDAVAAKVEENVAPTVIPNEEANVDPTVEKEAETSRWLVHQIEELFGKTLVNEYQTS